MPSKPSRLRIVYSYFAAIFAFLFGLLTIPYPLVSIFFAALGMLQLPQGRLFLERKLRINLSGRRRMISSAILLSGGFLAMGYYGKDMPQHRSVAIDEVSQKAPVFDASTTHPGVAEPAPRADSFEFFLDREQELVGQKHLDAAQATLLDAERFATTTERFGKLLVMRREIRSKAVVALVSKQKYRDALAGLDSLVESEPANDDLRVARALCYSKTGQMEAAVQDLQIAITNGSAEAVRMHEKINPMRRHVVDYLTRCCDGSLSPTNAKGRGACSHHGGVCDWNEPLYEEYRKY